MVKIHTRQKRKFNLTKGVGHRKRPKKKNGARTFSSKESALEWAKKHKLKGQLAPAKKGKRWKIIPA